MDLYNMLRIIVFRQTLSGAGCTGNQEVGHFRQIGYHRNTVMSLPRPMVRMTAVPEITAFENLLR